MSTEANPKLALIAGILMVVAGALGLAAAAINLYKGRTDVLELVLGAALLLGGIYYLRRGRSGAGRPTDGQGGLST
jgi:uncharacterized membrane protein YfcA